MKEGDNNTKFFHASMKERYRRNSIITVKSCFGMVVEWVSEVKEEIKNHFVVRFQRSSIPRPYLQNITFERLLNQDCGSLEEEFLEEEIKKVVFDDDGDKSPGPDGFN